MYGRGRFGGREGKAMKVFDSLSEYLKVLFVPDIKLESMPVPEKNPPQPMTGIGHLLSEFDSIPETKTTCVKEEVLPKINIKEQKRAEKMEQHKLELAEKIKNYNPDENPKATKNAMNTLFIGNLNYLTTESRLRDLCEKYGPIESVIVIRDQEGKSRGYAFVEYSYADDMKSAYNNLKHYLLDERPLIVDVERGRTVRKWLPARLGGGAGKTRITRPKKQKDKVTPRDQPRNDNRNSYRDNYGRRDGYGGDRRGYGGDRRDGYGGDRRGYGGDRRGYGGDRRDGYGGDRRGYGDDRRGYGDDRRRDNDRRRYYSV